jgi:hypothetical protein
MKINIISYEPINQWICGRIAYNLYEALKKLNLEVSISEEFDENSDINHHVIYTSYKKNLPGINTLMITHIDNFNKINQLKKGLSNGEVGICMSNHTQENLIKLGVNKNCLQVANIPPSLDLKFKKIKILISTRLYPDGRKNEDYLIYCFKNLNPTYFALYIMGYGWSHITEKITQLGFEVNYFEDFQKETYTDLLIKCDYYLYMGFDEGSMGFTDAASVGLKTIVSRQGHHLDAPSSINYSFKDKDELYQIFKTLEIELSNSLNEVKNWTWENYAKKHLEIWEILYSSGIKINKSTLKINAFKLLKNSILKYFYYLKNINNKFDTGSRYFKKK